jgi:hypothetical protein
MALTMNVLRAIPGNSFPRCIIGLPARPILLKAQDIGRSKPTIARVPGLGCVEMAILFGKHPFSKGVYLRDRFSRLLHLSSPYIVDPKRRREERIDIGCVFE